MAKKKKKTTKVVEEAKVEETKVESKPSLVVAVVTVKSLNYAGKVHKFEDKFEVTSEELSRLESLGFALCECKWDPVAKTVKKYHKCKEC